MFISENIFKVGVKKMHKHKLLNSLIALAVIILIWYVGHIISKAPYLPSPINVFKYTLVNFAPKIFQHVIASVSRVLLGIIFALLMGLPLGIWAGMNKTIDSIISPITYLLYPIPKIALLPLIMLIFGLGDFSKVFMIFLIVFFQVLTSMRDAVKNIPEENYHIMYSLGSSKSDILIKVTIKAILPEILTSLKISLATALSVLFFTETFGTEVGLGYFIMDSWFRVSYVEMFSGILVLAILGFSLFYLIDFLQRVLCKWKQF